MCGDNGYAEREKSLRKQLEKEKNVPLPSIGFFERLLKTTEKPMFEKYRTKFFMCDLYPENAERFTVKYEDIKDGVTVL